MYEPNQAPKAIDDCKRPDPIAEKLWDWSDNTEQWGKFLFWVIIAYGIIHAIIALATLVAAKSGVGLIFITVITTLLKYGVYAFIEYVAFYTIALLIASLATITENTTFSAQLKEYELRKAENDFGEKK